MLSQCVEQGDEARSCLRCFRMLRSQLLLPNLQRPLVERLGFRILALLTVETRKAVEWRGHIGMHWSYLLLPNLQRPPVERLGFRIPALLTVEVCQTIERGGHIGMLRS